MICCGKEMKVILKNVRPKNITGHKCRTCGKWIPYGGDEVLDDLDKVLDDFGMMKFNSPIYSMKPINDWSTILDEDDKPIPYPPTPPKCRTTQEGTQSELVTISMLCGFLFGMMFMMFIMFITL